MKTTLSQYLVWFPGGLCFLLSMNFGPNRGDSFVLFLEHMKFVLPYRTKVHKRCLFTLRGWGLGYFLF